MNWALTQTTGSPAAKAVLLILANRADHRGVCWPGLNGIATQTELARRTVVRQIKALVDSGLISVQKRPQPQTNLYLLNLSGSDTLSPCHSDTSDTLSPEVVSQCHLPSVTVSPEPSLTINKPTRGSKRAPRDFALTIQMYEWAERELGFPADRAISRS